jgi:hypothetical protein
MLIWVLMACSLGVTATVAKVAWVRVVRQRQMNNISYITADLRCVGIVHVEVTWQRSSGGRVSMSRGGLLRLGEGQALIRIKMGGMF